MKTSTRWLSSVAAAAALVALSSPTIADEAREYGASVKARAVVDAHDLDLSNPQDAEALYERIRGAARGICSRLYSSWRYVDRVQYSRECVETAVENAVGRANAPLLTAIHEGAKERVASL